MIYGGLDEANKGEVLNPIVTVLAYTDINPKNIELIKDSKSRKLSTTDLELIITKYRIQYEVLLLGPHIKKGYLHKDLLKLHKELIQKVNPDVLFIDSLISNSTKMRTYYREFFSKELVVQNRLDEVNPLVSIASHIARKVKNENLLELESQVKMKVGSGNLRDPVTVAYLKKKYPNIPGLKTSWSLKSLFP